MMGGWEIGGRLLLMGLPDGAGSERESDAIRGSIGWGSLSTKVP